MCYWFLCVPFTQAFAHPKHSSSDEEEITCLKRGLLVFANVVGYATLLGIVMFFQICLLLALFLSGGHFRFKAGWLLNAFLSATIIITIPTVVSFVLWSKRKQAPTPTEKAVEMESASPIEAASPVQIGELVVVVSENEDAFQESEGSSSFVYQCCVMRLLPFYIIVILLSEITLIFVNPFDSIFPIGIASDEIVVPLEGEFVRSKHCPSCPDHCKDVEQEIRKAREFYKHSLIDFSKVRIGYGGIPRHFNKDGMIGGQAIDRSVYLPVGACPDAWLMVHEFAHVWQMESGWWFQNGVSKLIRYKKEECKIDLYDYGGKQGLENAAKDPQATITSAFWVETQAQIVEDYWYCYWYRSCDSEMQRLLTRFASDILYDDSKLGKRPCEVEDLILTWVSSEDCPSEALSASEDFIEHVSSWNDYSDGQAANKYESHNDGIHSNPLQFPGCSSIYLSMNLREGISSGYCECDDTDDLCSLHFNDADHDESSNCGIYEIYQWSCPI